MTYDAKEKSIYEGSPVELYKFARGTTEFWHYTSADAEVSYLGDVYSALAIKRNKIELSQNIQTATLEITIPITAEIVQEYMAGTPTDPISLTLYRFHEGDTESASIWVGRVVNVDFREIKAEILCETIYTSLRRPTLRRLYSYTCPHVLYSIGDGLCNVVRATYKASGNLTAVSGVTLTSTTFGLQADDYYAGGYIEITVSGNTNRRFIVSHTGNDIVLNQQLFGAVVGSAFDAYPGCSHDKDTCKTKFNNVLNYGGFPWIPRKNPMGGAPIF